MTGARDQFRNLKVFKAKAEPELRWNIFVEIYLLHKEVGILKTMNNKSFLEGPII